MNLGLRDKIALVTAASKGLGKAVALRLAREGARVALCARNEKTLRKAATEVKKTAGRPALALSADVSDPAAVDALVKATVEQFGRIDALVINAGGPPPGQFLDLTPEDWEAAARLTLMSAVHLCYAVVPVMKEQGEGSILAMTSITVKQPLPNLILSNSLRLGVTGLVKTLADELAPLGIRVNSICPGNLLDSPLWVNSLYKQYAKKWGITEEEVRQKYVDQVPLKRGCTYDDVTNLLVFLASDAASYMTGQAVNVTGGQEMH